MAVFAYVALDRSGKQMAGTLPADNRASAMDQILGRGLSPIKLEEQRGKDGAAGGPGLISGLFGNKSDSVKVPMAALEAFTRELANLLSAGLPLARALHLLRREATHLAAKNVWNKIHEDVIGGTSLADAMAKFPKTFGTVYVAMVRAGESGGFLHVVLQQISDFRAREADLKGKVKAALVYPVVLGIFAATVLLFLLTFFIPKFQGIFNDFGAQLPYLTQVIVAISNVITSRWSILVAILLVAAVFGIRHWLQTEKGRRLYERAILATPVVGLVSARFGLVRFCRMLGTLVGAGVPLISSLRTARDSLGNQTLADAVTHAIDEVQRGEPLSKSLAATPILFPASVVEMIAIAEETGRLDKELVRLAISFEGELDRNLRMLVSLAEPLMLFLTAVMIGIVVVAMLLPILTLQDVVK